jgi:hypothetical protein
MAVHLVECMLQPLAGFAVDAADCILQRCHGLVEVPRLRVEVVLALARHIELFQRGKIDRTQPLDFLVQAIDLALEGAGSHALFDLLRYFLFARPSFGQMLRVLLLVEARLLLLEPQLRNAAAQRLELLLEPVTLFVDGLEGAFHAFQGISRLGERLFLVRTRGQRALQAVLQGRLVEPCQLPGTGFQRQLQPLGILRYSLNCCFYLYDFI